LKNLDRVIIVGGLPRTGKSILRNSIGSHSHIAFTPTGFNFFNIFNKKTYKQRGDFKENLNFFIKDHWQAKEWGINDLNPNINGISRKELYLSILELYRKKYWSKKRIIGTYIHNSEEYFDTLMDWFGYKNLKFIHIIRDPYDNYSSYIRARKISLDMRGPHRYNSFVNMFCNMWAQSAAIGLNGAIRYPDSYRTIYFNDLKSKPEEYLESLCDWIGIPFEKDRMLNMVDFPIKQKSSFKLEEKNTANIYKDSHNRKSYLSNYELETIASMASTNFLTSLGYNNQKRIINWKIKPNSNIQFNKYSNMIRSIKKTLLSPIGTKNTLLFYLRELFIFDNLKNIILISIYYIYSKVKR